MDLFDESYWAISHKYTIRTKSCLGFQTWQEKKKFQKMMYAIASTNTQKRAVTRRIPKKGWFSWSQTLNNNHWPSRSSPNLGKLWSDERSIVMTQPECQVVLWFRVNLSARQWDTAIVRQKSSRHLNRHWFGFSSLYHNAVDQIILDSRSVKLAKDSQLKMWKNRS